PHSKDLHSLRPGIARVKAEELPGRLRIVKHLSGRPARGVHDSKSNVVRSLDRTGEEAAGITRAQINVRPPRIRGQLAGLVGPAHARATIPLTPWPSASALPAASMKTLGAAYQARGVGGSSARMGQGPVSRWCQTTWPLLARMTRLTPAARAASRT